jgi:hypothetical protein
MKFSTFYYEYFSTQGFVLSQNIPLAADVLHHAKPPPIIMPHNMVFSDSIRSSINMAVTFLDLNILVELSHKK